MKVRDQKGRPGVEIKSAAVRIKASDETEGEGIVRGVASVWDNVDSYGDVMVKGAFADTLKEHVEAGDSIPFVWHHEVTNPHAYVGELTEVRETDEGLEFEARLDIEVNPMAAQVFRLLKGRRVRELSFGFIPRDTTPAKRDGAEVREVKSVELLEVSAVHVGANRGTRVVEVRAAGDESDGGGEADELVPGDEVAALVDEVAAGLAAISDAWGKLQEKLVALTEADDTEARAAASDPPRRPEDLTGKGSREVEDAAAASMADVMSKAGEALAIIEAERYL